MFPSRHCRTRCPPEPPGAEGNGVSGGCSGAGGVVVVFGDGVEIFVAFGGVVILFLLIVGILLLFW